MPETHKEYVRKRGNIKGKLTAFVNYVNSLSEGGLTQLQAHELELRVSKVENLYDQFYEVQSEMESLLEVDETDTQEKINFDNQYFAIMAKSKLMLRMLNEQKFDDAMSTLSNNDAGSSYKRNNNHGIKLPTIQVPKFSGQYEDWVEFRDTYISLIHDNSAISDIQKFHYLRASLEGGAAQIIRSTEFSAKNYKVAWESLCDRYNNEKLLSQNHIHLLFSIEPLKRECSLSLRNLIDNYSKNLRSLQALGESTSTWDPLIIYLVHSKLDSKTSREWEERKGTIKDKITLNDLFTFLKSKADLLEAPHLGQKTDYKPRYNSSTVKSLATSTLNTHFQSKCPLCQQDHGIFHCNTFLKQSPRDKAESARKLKLCTNCLRVGHLAAVCRSLGSCTKCASRHNTLLHEYFNQTSKPTYQVNIAQATNQADIKQSSDSNTTSLSVQIAERVLLSTALVKIQDKDNQFHEALAVLDSGSQASFMTESLQNKLNIKGNQTKTSVIGINNTISQITKRCNTVIQSRISTFTANISFLVLPNIANLCKNITHIKDSIQIPKNIQLADPNYFDQSNVELLLGADIFWELIEPGQIKLGDKSPILQQTKLGYIVSGPTSGLKHLSNHTNYISCNFVQNDFDKIQEQLAKFWVLEEPPSNLKFDYTVEEQKVEDHFLNNFKRNPDGRFSVAIPLKLPESHLGDSYEKVKQCFLSLEPRLARSPKLQEMYIEFMDEYKKLGHMSLISEGVNTDNQQMAYYLPHHGVLREKSLTTKLRTVFNASASTSTGLSLNDLQMVGPTIQSDLFTILIRFRHFSYVITGDIEKMYRQIEIHKNQRHLQRIIWRDDPSKDLNIYELNTVTYGTASAPFLAIRCLKQLALECTDPLISQVISEDFYVDDLVSGSQSIAQLYFIKEQVIQVLQSGCFNLRKIRSNVSNFSEHNSESDISINFGSNDDSINTLGIGWRSQSDFLHFSQKPIVTNYKATKRFILSSLGQIFDPLGLLSVFIIKGKIIMQKIWLLKVSWDEVLPQVIQDNWNKFISDLKYVQNLRIPRCVTSCNPKQMELHIFCDSSQEAYGACVFVRSVSSQNNITVKLLCSKSKVAPLKPLTIPRLELCGALVAARLGKKVIEAFRLTISRVIFWSDSSIVLGWLRTSPVKLKQFVKSRVTEIQDISQSHEWRHIPTAINPADLLTRGVDMSKIQDLELWWSGPKFLLEPESNWPFKNFTNYEQNLPEVITVKLATESQPKFEVHFERFSKLTTLKRVFAYIFRLAHNSKAVNKSNKLQGPLSVIELDEAFTFLIKQSQIISFADEFKILSNPSTSKKSSFLALSPFVDNQGLLRVGGRLRNSNFSYNEKHPIFLSCNHHLAKLIFQNEHLRLGHAGPQLMLSSIRQRFWPIGGRNMARFITHKCVVCVKMRAKTINPIMGQLPEQRLSPGYAFQYTGVDYAGPMLSADRRGRGSRLIKVYVGVFVCFTTKALHLELISDLTKEAYITALRRFIARRSKPSILFSDNGTQFVGAKNEIQKFLKQNSSHVTDVMANDNIQFKFIPAYAPHFGGLWEAGVKSFKFHLHRILGNSRQTFEELYTTLVQIESILNSRPLSPISSDPNDLNPLTPGHFLVGRPLTALPSPSLEEINPLRLQRWDRVEQLRQHFWTRWQKEYVSELQQKTKWKTSHGQLQKGTMVVIKEDGLPPMKWCLGRVQEVITGTDNVGRVADILTTKGIIRRAFNRICPLPIQTSPDN